MSVGPGEHQGSTVREAGSPGGQWETSTTQFMESLIVRWELEGKSWIWGQTFVGFTFLHKPTQGHRTADICVKLRDKSCSLQLGSCFCELSYLLYWGSEYTVNKQTKTCHTNLYHPITSDFKVLHFGFLSMLMSYKKVKSTTSDICTLNQSAAV